MKAHPNLISKKDEILELAKKLRDVPEFAFDTEFIRESTFFPDLQIIQIATRTESWLIDAEPFKKDKRGYPGISGRERTFKRKHTLSVFEPNLPGPRCLWC